MQTKNLSILTIISAMFLVAGTCIGGGMLALPVATGTSGFLPSAVVMFLGWLGMTITALLLLEVSLWMEEGAHVITMTSRLLGVPGKIVSWVLYLFICYASLIAYTAGGGLQIASTFSQISPFPLSKEMGCVLFIFIFGAIIDLGSKVVGRVNSLFFVAMCLAYVALVVTGSSEIKINFLGHQKWQLCLLALPLTLTTFSFQTMVPSLTPYLQRNVKALRYAIIGGTTLTFIIYLIWQTLVLGIVPVEGPLGLSEALIKGEPPTQFLKQHVDGWWVSSLAEFFAFFAIVTSFFGIGLGLFDFLSDGLKIKERGWGRLGLGALIVIPTLFFAITYERAFLVAMETTGGIGDSILNGLFPVLMVWIGRYHLGYEGIYKVSGGKPLLAVTFFFFLSALIIQIISYF